MPTTNVPGMRDMNGGNRPWSIGSQLLGHYNLDPSTNSVPNHSITSSAFPAIDFQNSTIQPTSYPNSLPPYDESSRPSTLHAATIGAALEDSDQRPLLRASTTFYERIVTDWWWWELLSCLVSIACSAAIVGVLLHYDGKRQPQYLLPGITLNAYIAVFAAIAKAALILPVSEAIGQLKWLWFREEANLWDFYTFDGASRGPWGALMLLGRTKCRHLVSLGASITVLALAFEPFFQQIVSFPSRDIMSHISTVSIATRYVPADDRQYTPRTNKLDWSGSGRTMGIDAIAAVLSRERAVKPPPSVCPSGQCNWTSYSTLGVCHQCEDLSTFLVYSCEDRSSPTSRGHTTESSCGYRMNGTHFLGTWGYKQKRTAGLSTVVVGDPVVFGVPESWNSSRFSHASNAILDFYIAFTPGNETQIRDYASPKLLECLLYWCVKTMESSYSSGVLQEKVIHTYAEQSTNPGYQRQNDLPSGPFVFNLGEKLFEVGKNTTQILAQATLEALPRSLGAADIDEEGLYPGMWSIVQSAPYDINPLFVKLTDAMTNNIRSLPSGTEKMEGIAWSTQTFVEARWLWVTLPVTLTLGTLLLLCSTILVNRAQRVPTWKSSALATLLHGITEHTRQQFESASTMSQAEAMSQTMRVKLSIQEGSGRLLPV